MAGDSFALQEMQVIVDGPVVRISFIDIGMPRSEMRS